MERDAFGEMGFISFEPHPNCRSKVLSPWWIGKSPKHLQKIKYGEKTWKMQPTNLEHKNDNASFFGWWGSCSGQWTKTGFPSSLVKTFRWGKMGVNMCKYICKIINSWLDVDLWTYCEGQGRVNEISRVSYMKSSQIMTFHHFMEVIFQAVELFSIFFRLGRGGWWWHG